MMAHTGLPNANIFSALLRFMSNFDMKYHLKWNVIKYSKEDQLLMTLMKLRLDLRGKDLAVRFGCSPATITNITETWIIALHQILFVQLMKDIPSKEKNMECLPLAFKDFASTRIIIDCTEIQTDRPHLNELQKKQYSSYKHMTTAKGLVGVAPNGVITYLSSLYPGSISDKKIFNDCDLKEKLLPGDQIMADKGFLIKDDLPPGVSLVIPPFLTQQQFTPDEVRETYRIATARVHVERANNRMKCFRILERIPYEYFHLSSTIFQLVGALSNLQHPIIKEVEHSYF